MFRLGRYFAPWLCLWRWQKTWMLKWSLFLNSYIQKQKSLSCQADRLPRFHFEKPLILWSIYLWLNNLLTVAFRIPIHRHILKSGHSHCLTKRKLGTKRLHQSLTQPHLTLSLLVASGWGQENPSSHLWFFNCHITCSWYYTIIWVCMHAEHNCASNRTNFVEYMS